MAGGAACQDANPSPRDHATAGPPPRAPLARQHQYQPSMTGTCPTVWFELCTACSGTLSPQQFTASLALSSPAPLQPWPFAKIATCLLLRASTRAPGATLCTSRTAASSSEHGRQPHGEHAAKHCKQRCTWRRWRRQQRQQAQPHHLTLAMRTVLSAAGPMPAHLAMRPAAVPQEARGATHQLLTVVRLTGTESGRQEGLKQLHVEAIAVTPRCHRAGEADVVEAEAELHVKLT